MPESARLAISAWNLALNAALDQLDGGYVHIFEGSRPESPEDDEGTSAILATIRLGAKAFMPAFDGMKKAKPIEDTAAEKTGIPSWFRAYSGSGTPVLDGSVGTSDSDMVVDVDHFEELGVITIKEWTIGCPGSE